MSDYAGLDASLKETSVCVVDGAGGVRERSVNKGMGGRAVVVAAKSAQRPFQLNDILRIVRKIITNPIAKVGASTRRCRRYEWRIWRVLSVHDAPLIKNKNKTSMPGVVAESIK